MIVRFILLDVLIIENSGFLSFIENMLSVLLIEKIKINNKKIVKMHYSAIKLIIKFINDKMNISVTYI